MGTTYDTDRVWAAIDEQRSSLADLLDGLAPEQWDAASLCAGWRVRDVAAHLTQAHGTAGRALADLVRARGSMHRMIRESAIRQAELPTGELTARLRAMVGSRRRVPGLTPLEPLLDVLVHGQDIAVPLGIDRPMPAEASRPALERAVAMSWYWPPQRDLRGLGLRATDSDFVHGRGPEVKGRTGDLLLLVTGRTSAALPRLGGDGAAALAGRR
jgi:uncharacterized protein (TIGR03083 family)